MISNASIYRVDTRVSTLRLRSEPRRSAPMSANVIAELPDGQRVRLLSAANRRGFVEVETTLDGTLLRGFVAASYLVALPSPAASPAADAIAQDPLRGVVAVDLPRPVGLITRRRDVAGAHPLNERGQPGRPGTTAEGQRRELLAIVQWLAVDNPAFKRYQPRAGATFCNIYCHDLCHLAGAYLPRTWWSATAIVEFGKGHAVEPLIGNSVHEMRANGLFQWLGEFGAVFGWQRVANLDGLQQAANQGGVALIVARRKENGKPGHIVAVVPEADGRVARRNKLGEVSAPLQSQAGSRNFQFGTGSPGWWKRGQFADFAFWVHA